MGHSRRRPIAGRVTGTGESIVVVEAFQRPISVQVVLNGGTATVEYSNENVLYDAAAQAAVNIVPQVAEPSRYVDPASANWTTLTLTGGRGVIDEPVFAIRVNATGAGSPGIDYWIHQDA